MKVEEDLEGLAIDDALISTTTDLFSAIVPGTTTETGQPRDMWPTIEPYPMGDDLAATASWAVEDVVCRLRDCVHRVLFFFFFLCLHVKHIVSRSSYTFAFYFYSVRLNLCTRIHTYTGV